MPSKRVPTPDPNELLSLARTSLAAYAPLMFPTFQLARHHSKLIRKLEDVEAGRIRRLMIFMPPRHGKSLLTTQIFPSWFLGRNPAKNVITATYSQDLSDDFGRVVRNFVSDPYARAVFPELKIAEDSNSMKRFMTNAGGAYYAVGRGAAITGRGADLLLIDDPLKDMEEARSENIRRTLHDWYSSVAYTRLQPDGAIILIQTRWHHDDLAGWLLREHGDEGWDVLNLPAVAETDGDGRKEGDPLWPERFTSETLKSIKVAVGGATWAALYQQRPSAVDGEIFKREWWKSYRDIPELKRVIQSWDTAFKTGSQNDYSVCTTWGEAVNGYYLLDLWRGRVEFPQLKKKVSELASEWKPEAILIEDKASGQSLLQEIRQSTRHSVLAIKVDTDKISRASAASPMVEAGKVFIPESAPWLADFLYEMSVLPVGAHDDIADSVSQALNWMRGSHLTYGLLEFYAQTQAELASGTSAMVNGQLMAKPESVSPLTECPECGSTCTQRIPGGQWRCGSCGVQWGAKPFEVLDSQRMPVWRVQ
jgi:predicted phage terminase large subunit-like protein